MLSRLRRDSVRAARRCADGANSHPAGLVVLAAAQVKPVSPQEAYAVFQDVNEMKELLGPQLGKIVENYKALAEEHCSGLRLADGTRVSLESRGEDYGLFTIYREISRADYVVRAQQDRSGDDLMVVENFR
jgi:hypothetical protein